MDQPLIELRNITVWLREPGGGFFGLGRPTGVRALTDVSLRLAAGQTLGLFGESGSGKTTLARVLTGRLRPDQGAVLFDGANLARLSARAAQPKLRRLQLLSQDAGERFDRERTLGKQMAEELTQRGLAGGAAQARQKLASAFEAVELEPALLERRPHQLSGGELQRCAIARLVALGPKVVALDEPVSGVDPGLRARLMDLLQRLQRERNYAYLYITHDLGQIRRMAGAVAVLQRGRIVEQADTGPLLAEPLHPYTQALLTPGSERVPDPDPAAFPSGCWFHPQCPNNDGGRCTKEVPALREVAPGRQAACHLL